MGVFTLPNPNYNKTITIYNKYKENGKEAWHKTVLPNCFFKCETHTSFAGTKASKSNTYTVRIPNNTKYCPPNKFTNIVGCFTLQEGDLIVLGACDDDITGERGNTATDVMQRYKPNAFRISTVADNTAFIGGHYRVGG